MKKILHSLRQRPGVFYFVLFVFLIVPALLLYPAAEGDSPIAGFLLALIILANLLTMLY